MPYEKRLFFPIFGFNVEKNQRKISIFIKYPSHTAEFFRLKILSLSNATCTHTLARGSQENEQEISGFVSQKWHSKIFKLTGFFLFSKYFRYTFSRNVVFRYCLEFFSIRAFSSLRKKLNHATRTQVRSLTITLAFRSSVSKLISLLGEDSL